MLCPECGFTSENPEIQYCIKCGTKLVEDTMLEGSLVKCPHCRLLVPAGEEICPQCGNEISKLPELKLTPPGPLTGFFKQRIALLGAILGLVFSVILIYLLYQIARPETFIQKMFLPGGVLNSVPWTISYLFLWSVSVLLIRAISLAAQRRILKSRKARTVEQRLKEKDISGVVKELENVSKSNSFFHRISRALYIWTITGQRESVDDELRRQADLDTETTIGGYTAIRTFIWAMPVIGFIGTVIGISLAVGDFSTFLGGEIENIDLVKSQLIEVTNGLSFAFLTTLLGLLGALFVMLPAAALQNAEEEFCVELDSVARDMIIPNLNTRRIDKIMKPDTYNLVEQITEVLKASLPDLAELKVSIHDYTKALLDDYSKAAHDLQRSVLLKHEQGYSKLIAEVLKKLQSGMDSITDNVVNNIKQSGNSNEERINEAGNSNIERINQAMHEVGERIIGLGEKLSE